MDRHLIGFPFSDHLRSGDCHTDTRERQDQNQSPQAEGSGRAHQETRSRRGQSRERQERERTEGERQIKHLHLFSIKMQTPAGIRREIHIALSVDLSFSLLNTKRKDKHV